MQYTLIANPENRRCQYFLAAAKSQGLATPLVISYLDLLNNRIDLAAVFKQTTCLKIESFGENFEVQKQLLALASHQVNPNFISKAQSLNLAFEKGRIQHSKQLYTGYTLLLDKIQKELNQQPLVKSMNSPKSIALMFDKIACHQHFTSQKIATIPALYHIKNYEHLRSELAALGWKRVFIKPAYSSSASGVIALRMQGTKIQAISSAELVEKEGKIKIYNSLKIRQYTDEQQIKKLVDKLAQNDIIVERWIPKATTPKGVFDLRIVVIGGKTNHIVVRQSQSPLTNLHLGNQRGNLLALQQQLGAAKWAELCQLAENAAQTLPQTLYTGLDILLSSNLQKSYILEANAFGDLLPNVLVKGLDTYQTQISCSKFL